MIKNIIFDVGNVLLEYRWEYPLQEFGLERNEAVNLDKMLLGDDIWKELDRGNILEPEGEKLLMEKYVKYADAIHYFFQRVDEIAIGRPDVWRELPVLREKGYHLYILSNYPEHMFKEHTKNSGFFPYMDGALISYQVHLSKPDERIYRALLDKYGLDPKECIFLDDREENVLGGEKAGIKGIVIESREQLKKELKKMPELK